MKVSYTMSKQIFRFNYILGLVFCLSSMDGLSQAVDTVATSSNSVSQHIDSVPPLPKPVTTILLPLYLDSAFSDGRYQFKNSMPSFLIPGLEFYNGVRIASEELQEQGIMARIKIIDTKSPTFIYKLFRDTAVEVPGIVIAMAQTAAELKNVAELLKPSGRPLISLLPNDVGMNGYPNLMVANTTLRTHCSQLYRYIRRNHSLDNIILLTPSGNIEERLKGYLKEDNQNAVAGKLTWKELEMKPNFAVEQLLPFLDSTRQNIIISPTLNANHAQKIVKMLSGITLLYATSVFGMPTWETVPFTRAEYKGVDVYYGTPFVTATANAELYEQFVKKYYSLTNSRPSDIAFRGYEITMRYAKTFSMYGPEFMEHINDSQQKLFTDFNFQPVGNTNRMKADYLENTRIYFVKKTDGIIRDVQLP